MITLVTSGTTLVYTSQTYGGAGLIVDSNTPSLVASLVGVKYQELDYPIYASILGLQSDNTNSFLASGSLIYTGPLTGAVGLIGIVQNPDLFATYTIDPSRFRPDRKDLLVTIRAKKEDSKDLKALVRAAASGYLDLQADIHGFDYRDLSSVIRAQRSGTASLSGFIEPVPPADLNATLQGFSFLELSGTIEPIPPVELPATISGQEYLDLYGNIEGYDYTDLGATYCGTNASNLNTLISGLASGFANLTGQIQGFLGLGVSGDLGGYIVPQFSGTQNLNANISGVVFKDLAATLRVISGGIADLEATISGDSQDTLIGNITATGSLLDLSSYITGSKSLYNSLSSFIDGYGLLDLQATIDSETQGVLFANISPSGSNSGVVFASISGVFSESLQAEYEITNEGLLSGSISPIPTSALYAVIQPKVYFIDSTLPINTFPVTNLKAVINAYNCDFDSFYSDLSVVISGTSAQDLSASIVSVVGQYAMASDELKLLNKAMVVSEDWAFFILKQPILAEDGIQLILTNSPLSDLAASIVGVQAHEDLSASISSSFFATVKRDGVPLGQWVNLKTGERRLIKVFFEGNASNFYYSSTGNKTYSENALDSLKVVVEIYTKEDDSNSLLARKTEVKRCIVDNLTDFESIDSAIKFGIMCAAGEISSGLRAEIVGVGETKDLRGSVTAVDYRRARDLRAGILAVQNQPELNATISGSGDVSDLSGYISPTIPSLTQSEFTDTLGNRYLPKLVAYGNNQFSVVLTKVLSTDTISVADSPDLYASIYGMGVSDIDATISGS
jgi:hypothetical protein